MRPLAVADAAFDELRKRGLVAAAKKVFPSFCLQVAWPKRRDASATPQAGRTAAEGLVCVTVQGSEAALVEINSETDFVARSAPFQVCWIQDPSGSECHSVSGRVSDSALMRNLAQALLRAVAASALLCPYPSEEGPRVIRGLSKEALQARLLPGTAESVAGAVTALAAEVRENISLRRAFRCGPGDDQLQHGLFLRLSRLPIPTECHCLQAAD